MCKTMHSQRYTCTNAIFEPILKNLMNNNKKNCRPSIIYTTYYDRDKIKVESWGVILHIGSDAWPRDVFDHFATKEEECYYHWNKETDNLVRTWHISGCLDRWMRLHVCVHAHAGTHTYGHEFANRYLGFFGFCMTHKMELENH